MKKGQLEEIKMELETNGHLGSGILKAVNVEILDNGFVKKRRGYNTFGEMVDVLWSINKQNKKMGFTGDYTVRLPLKGTKPVYKKTLKK